MTKTFKLKEQSKFFTLAFVASYNLSSAYHFSTISSLIFLNMVHLK